jgi:EAL domain-containing protein (putative c-di-GMP-specific phosphodiesterase class I)
MQSNARQALDRLGELLIVQGHEIHLSASIGIATYPKDADNVIDLTRSADAALYHAKRHGGRDFEFFDAEMNAAAVDRLMLKSKLRRSYELNELLMHYQPKIDLSSGKVVGAEALVRWEMSERGIVFPSEFIPLAEETNLIIEIGDWILNQVCMDISKWQGQLHGFGRTSVNLSLKQLGQSNFTARVKEILDHHGIDPSTLELEVTETTLMQDMTHVIRVLNELHAAGVKLSIDDFGTGYSSLSALQKFPISTLKIDKSFVHDLPTDKDDSTIVSTIIDMAHGMGMDVVAEGVESELQLDFLKSLNCNYVQGLLFGDPMTADEYLNLLIIEQEGEPSYRSLFA